MISPHNCFTLLQQGDLASAEEWAEKARQADAYNSDAFVNLGSCAFAHGEFDKARAYFSCALENDPSCFGALFNLGEPRTYALFHTRDACIQRMHFCIQPRPCWELRLEGRVARFKRWMAQFFDTKARILDLSSTERFLDSKMINALWLTVTVSRRCKDLLAFLQFYYVYTYGERAIFSLIHKTLINNVMWYSKESIPA